MMVLPVLALVSAATPVLSTRPHWVGVVMIITAALFLAALVIGPILHMHRVPEEPPHRHHLH